MIRVGDKVDIESWHPDDRYSGMCGEVTNIEEYAGERSYTVWFSELDKSASFGQDSVVGPIEDDRGEIYE